MKEFEISLDNIKFFSHHGIFSHETSDGNEFEVNLSVRYEVEGNQRNGTENSEEYISYVRLYEIVKEEMSVPRKLLETVAENICNRIKEEFPQCSEIECRVYKLIPPISGFMGSASVIFRLKD